MYDHDHSASKGYMNRRGLYVFKHVGHDATPAQRERQAKLGCAPAQALLDLGEVIEIQKNEDAIKKDNDIIPRKFEHYTVQIHTDRIPKGIELWAWDDSTAGLKKIHG